LEHRLLFPGEMAVTLIKPALAALGATTLFAASFYVSTEVGFQTSGWHEVTVELPRNPGFAAVGQTFATPDGSKLLVTAIRPGESGKHHIHGKVEGMHRYALALFPTRWEHSFAMDRSSLEWTLRHAGGQPLSPLESPPQRRWHVLN
jgi:hypothetical protein